MCNCVIAIFFFASVSAFLGGLIFLCRTLCKRRKKLNNGEGYRLRPKFVVLTLLLLASIWFVRIAVGGYTARLTGVYHFN